MMMSSDSLLFGTTTKLPLFVRTFTARQVISLTSPSMSAIRTHWPTAKWFFDLNRQAREQVAQRVLQREAHDHRTDRSGGKDFFLKDHRRADGEEPDDDGILHDGRKAIRQTMHAPWIDDHGDDGR